MLNDFSSPPSQRLTQTLADFDKLNAGDPNTEVVSGHIHPKEWLYGQRMSQQLAQFAPNASEYLQLAARAQHLCRWKIPRNSYPMDRSGYKAWRLELAHLHAKLAGETMASNGYTSDEISIVADLLLKKNLKRNVETQTLEDVACLVFLKFHLEDFAVKHDSSKLIDIIRKTWNKMSEEGHEAALQLTYSPHILQLIQRALTTQ